MNDAERVCATWWKKAQQKGWASKEFWAHEAAQDLIQLLDAAGLEIKPKDATKRYALFQGEGGQMPPAGGWRDFTESFDAFELATQKADAELKHPGEWYQIVDLQTVAIVAAKTKSRLDNE